MNTMRETQQFTEEHLAALRRAYNGLQRIDPCSDTYQRFRECVLGCGDDALLQLARANVKFVSVLAMGVARSRNLL